jgi:predicted TIM-barrel fold metal-dependent hydrolase
LKLNCVGILDIVSPSDQSEEDLRRQDIKSFGELVLDLATKNPTAHTDIPKNLQDVNSYTCNYYLLEIRATYSAEFCDFVQYILEDQEKNLDKIIEKIAGRILHEMNYLHEYFLYFLSLIVE